MKKGAFGDGNFYVIEYNPLNKILSFSPFPYQSIVYVVDKRQRIYLG